MPGKNRPSRVRRRRIWWAQQGKWVKTLKKDIDVVGAPVAEAIEAYWAEHGIGPHWREVFEGPVVKPWWKAATELEFVGKPFTMTFMDQLRQAGWVAFNTRERSLCAGRRYHVTGRAEVSQAPACEVGWRSAQFAAEFAAGYGHHPGWIHLAAATDEDGAPLFAGPGDAEAQYRWLATSGWLKRGPHGTLQTTGRANTEARRRATISAKVG